MPNTKVTVSNVIGAVGSVVERFVHTEEVTGSNPVLPIHFEMSKSFLPCLNAGNVPRYERSGQKENVKQPVAEFGSRLLF